MNTAQTNPSLIVGVREVAAMLDVSVRQIWRLNKLHQLPQPVRLGRLVKWNRDEIVGWVERGCPDTLASPITIESQRDET